MQQLRKTGFLLLCLFTFELIMCFQKGGTKRDKLNGTNGLLQNAEKKSQKTRQSTVQEINGVQSWISPPPLMAPKHCTTSILGAVIVSERGFLEPQSFPERRVVGH